MPTELEGIFSQSASQCPLAAELAKHLRQSNRELTAHWLERIAARVSIDPQRVFPSADLLDHVPLLIDGIADYLEDPADEISADIPVVAKAMELGTLRHAQGFDAHQILKEYEILGGIIFSYLAHTVDEMTEPCEKSELLACGHRLFRAVSIIQQVTTGQFLRHSDQRVAEREGRLRAFNRSVSHEIKNRIGVVLGASETLREVPGLADEERKKLLDMISRNMQSMQGAVENILDLSRMDTDARQHRHVRLPEAAREAARQLRDTAHAANVRIRIAPDLPGIEVNASAVELCLTNLLSNSIKYADPNEPERFAEIIGGVEDDPEGVREVVVRVRDNGLGVPGEKRERLFERFFRAHETVTGAEGTGLGLSIVRETAESLGGRAWAEFPQRKGATFAFSLPYRRQSSAES